MFRIRPSTSAVGGTEVSATADRARDEADVIGNNGRFGSDGRFLDNA